MLNLHNSNQDLITWDYRDMIQQYDLQGGGTAYYQYGNDKQRSRKVIEGRENGIKEERLLPKLKKDSRLSNSANGGFLWGNWRMKPNDNI